MNGKKIGKWFKNGWQYLQNQLGISLEHDDAFDLRHRATTAHFKPTLKRQTHTVIREKTLATVQLSR